MPALPSRNQRIQVKKKHSTAKRAFMRVTGVQILCRKAEVVVGVRGRDLSGVASLGESGRCFRVVWKKGMQQTRHAKRRRQLLDVVKLIESHCRGSHSESIHIWIWNLGRLNRPSHSPRARRPRPYSWLSKFTTIFLTSTHNGAALISLFESNLHLVSVTGKDTDESSVRYLIWEYLLLRK